MMMQSRKRASPRAPTAQRYKRRRPLLPIPRSLVRDYQFFDLSFQIGTNLANWTYTNLFQPAQGSNSSDRFGDKTLAMSLQYFLYLPQGVSIPMRIIIFYDRQSNGALPTSPAPMYTADTESFKNPDLRLRFKILRDFWIGNMGQNAIASSNETENNMQRGLIKLNLPTTFTGTGGSITNISSGSFGIAIYNGATNPSPAIIGNSRILFQS